MLLTMAFSSRVSSHRMTIPVKKRPSGAELSLTLDQAAARRSAVSGRFEDLFFAHKGRGADKWDHYLPFYDRAFGPYRSRRVRMLEIGVMLGGSLELWRKFFGPDATIFGIDIDPECANRVDPPNQVRIGSQGDAKFLRDVVAEMGGLDIVLDDGSHVANHQFTSFETLWPLLSTGGLYVIEDLHTAYWPEWEGGIRRPRTAIEVVKQLIDDMHARYHPEPEELVSHSQLGSIFISDSIVAIEKVDRPPTGHVWVGH